MKKILFTLVLFFFISAYSYSQMNTGSLFASGTTNLNFKSYADKDIDNSDYKVNYTDISFNPKVGYFLKNRIGVGGMMELSRNKTKYNYLDTEDTETESSFLIGPFARYYVEYGSIIPFAEVGAGIGSTKYVYKSGDVEGGESETKHSQMQVNLGAGADFFLNDYCAVEGMLQYFYNKQKPTTEGNTGSGHASSGLVISFGLTIFFGSI
jgi:hypothetical protein